MIIGCEGIVMSEMGIYSEIYHYKGFSITYTKVFSRQSYCLIKYLDLVKNNT